MKAAPGRDIERNVFRSVEDFTLPSKGPDQNDTAVITGLKTVSFFSCCNKMFFFKGLPLVFVASFSVMMIRIYLDPVLILNVQL